MKLKLITAILLTLAFQTAWASNTIELDEREKSLFNQLSEKPEVSQNLIDKQNEIVSEITKKEDTTLSKMLEEKSDSQNPSYLTNALSFIFVATLIVILGFGLKRFLRGGSSLLNKKSSPLKLIQMLSVGVKKNLAVVEFDGKKLLVGLTQNGMQLLYQEEKAALKKSKNKLQTVSESFSHVSKQQSETPKIQETILEPNTQPEKPLTAAEKVRNKIQSLKNLGTLPQVEPFQNKSSEFDQVFKSQQTRIKNDLDGLAMEFVEEAKQVKDEVTISSQNFN